MKQDKATRAPDGAAPVETCACGHDISYHGRRGYGACRRGWKGTLAYAVAVVRAGVVSGASQEQIHDGVGRAMEIVPCSCKRFRKGNAARSDAPKEVHSRGTP